MRIYILFLISLAVTAFAEKDALKQAVKNKYLRAQCTSLEIGCSCIEGKDSEGGDIVKVYKGKKATLCFEYKMSEFAKAKIASEMKEDRQATSEQIQNEIQEWERDIKYDQDYRFRKYKQPRKM